MGQGKPLEKGGCRPLGQSKARGLLVCWRKWLLDWGGIVVWFVQLLHHLKRAETAKRALNNEMCARHGCQVNQWFSQPYGSGIAFARENFLKLTIDR